MLVRGKSRQGVMGDRRIIVLGINYPVLVAVPSKEDIVADVVIVEVLESSVAVGSVSLG